MPSPEQPPAHTILIVDQDFGFLMWLGHTLALKGYLTLPSTNALEALRIIADLEIGALDLLIVDPAMPDNSHLVDALRGRQGALKVIWIEDSGRRATDIQEIQLQWIANVQEALEKNKAAGGR
jgi:DNA-binding NtrC family response regulator